MMRVPRVRFTVQQFMLAVAAGTIVIVVPPQLASYLERKRVFQELAAGHQQSAAGAGAYAADCEMRADKYSRLANTDAPPPGNDMILGPNQTWADYSRHYAFTAGRARAAARHFAAMAEKYTGAAAYPWLPVEPDPPPPPRWFYLEMDPEARAAR
jgi:hypothetical protein